MVFAPSEFLVVLPEIFVASMVCLMLVIDVFLSDRQREITYRLALGTLIATAALIYAWYPAEASFAFSGAFVSDRMSAGLKIFVMLTTFVVFLYSREYLRARELFKGEYFVLGLMAVLGMMVLISSANLLSVYLGLELLSLSLYAMVAFHRDSPAASEAAMKYFVLGALASGMLLYGMSMLYGAAGTLHLSELALFVDGQAGESLVLVLGLVFVVVGIAFKLGAVPFHMWVPDVYEGAPTCVTLFVGTAPKVAGFAMLVRLLEDGLMGLNGDWTQMLVVLAVLSMGVGNVIAIAQTNLKRMLAYSTIAHVGFLFLGVIAGTAAGFAASMFYIIAYALMAMGGFGMIILLSRKGFEADRLVDFKGLNERSAWFAFLMLVLMLSMAGVPPFLGFWAKWSVLRELLAAGMVWLAVVAVLFSVIGLFYYLRIIRLMYFEQPEDSTPLASDAEMRVALSANGLAILGLGLYPSALMALCVAAFAP